MPWETDIQVWMTTIQVSMFLQFSVLGKGLEKGKGGLRLDRWGSGFQFKNPKINFAVTQSSLRTKLLTGTWALFQKNFLHTISFAAVFWMSPMAPPQRNGLHYRGMRRGIATELTGVHSSHKSLLPPFSLNVISFRATLQFIERMKEASRKQSSLHIYASCLTSTLIVYIENAFIFSKQCFTLLNFWVVEFVHWRKKLCYL